MGSSERPPCQSVSRYLHVGAVLCSECSVGRALGHQEGQFCPLLDEEVKKGETLYREGQSADFVWFVKAGVIALERSGDRAQLALRCPGCVLGVETLQGGVYRSDARALVDSIVCRGPSSVWCRFLKASGRRGADLMGNNYRAVSEEERT